MRTSLSLSLFIGLAACGGSNNNTTPDAPSVVVPQMIKISGIASGRTATGSSPLSGVLVGAYKNSDDTTAITTAMSDATGAYSLTVATGGQPLDGFVKATIATYVDTYLYPPAPLTADFASASVNMVQMNLITTIGTLCNMDQILTDGAIAVELVDANAATVGGAVATATPTPGKICYDDSNDFPKGAATVTATDGLAYMLNVTGDVTVGATLAGATFHSHQVTARAGALTTTIISE
jgi:hypothetical protein